MTLDKILKILTIIVSLLVVETIITFINDLSFNRQPNFKITRALKEQYTNAVNYCGNNKFANREIAKRACQYFKPQEGDSGVLAKL